MAGPKRHFKQGWEMLWSKMGIEPETGLGLYLGCKQSKGKAIIDGKSVDMEEYSESAGKKYLEIIGGQTKLKEVKTPSLPEEPKNHKSRKPYSSGDAVECAWCKCSFDPAPPQLRRRPRAHSLRMRRAYL